METKTKYFKQADDLSTNLDIYSKNGGSFGFMQNKLEGKCLQIMHTNHIIWQQKR